VQTSSINSPEIETLPPDPPLWRDDEKSVVHKSIIDKNLFVYHSRFATLKQETQISRRLGMYGTILLLLCCISLGLVPINVNAAMKSIGKDKANIRSAPGMKGEVVFKAPLGYPVEVKSKLR
jgi:hypothetical protein